MTALGGSPDNGAIGGVSKHRLLALLICLVAWPTVASADRIDRLIQILHTDPSYKVRLRVVITLADVRDRRVAPALVGALSDRHHLVRALSTKALAQIGVTSALPAIQRLARSDPHHYTRRMATRAARRLSAMRPRVAPRPRLYVKVGKVHNRSGTGKQQVVVLLSLALEREFGRVPGVTTRWAGPGPSAADLLKQRMKGFVLSGSIQRLHRRRSGADLEVSCSIRVELSTYPGLSMKAVYSGQASLQVTSRSNDPQFLQSLYRDIFAGAAREARKQIVRSYLGTQ